MEKNPSGPPYRQFRSSGELDVLLSKSNIKDGGDCVGGIVSFRLLAYEFLRPSFRCLLVVF